MNHTILTMFCMTRYHCRQLFSNRRWLLVLALDVFLAVADAISLKIRVGRLLTAGVAVPANIWDVPVGVLCRDEVAVFTLVVAFVFLAGDALLRDERTGRLPMLISRTNNRATWFVSLIPAIALAAVAFVAVAILISVGVALLVLPAHSSWSPYVTNNTSRVVSLRGFYLPDMPPAPPLFFLGIVGYLAPALCSVALMCVVISLWWQRAIAAFAPVIWLLMDSIVRGKVLAFWPGGGRFMFSHQLVLTYHWQWIRDPGTAALYPSPVAASVIAFCILCVVLSAVGYFSVQRVDLTQGESM
jgi:hypothetical protein